MRVLAALLVALLPAAVFAQGIRYDPGPKMKSAMLPQALRVATASGILDLSKCADGSTNYPCAATEATVKPVGGTVTVSAGASLCGATLAAVGANDLCLPDANGAAIYSAAQHSNKFANSDPASWTVYPSASVALTANSADCPLIPDGSARMTKAVFNSGGYLLQNTSGFGANGAEVWSAWLALVTGDSACAIDMQNVNTSATLASPTLTATPTRKTVSTVATAGGLGGGQFQRKNAGQCAQVCVWGATDQLGSVTGFTVTSSGTPISGAADVASVATTITNPAKWCVGVRATTSLWSVSAGTRGLWAIGTPSTANSAYLILIGGTLYFDVHDASAAQKRISVAHGFADGTTHDLIACNVGGSMSLWRDTTETTTMSGAGTGMQASLAATVTVGAQSSLYQFGGSLAKVCQGSTVRAIRKCLEAP